jgi:hypothetical protein
VSSRASQPSPCAVTANAPLAHPALDVVIPVHDEERTLARSVRTLHGHLTREFSFPFRITVADNASTDATLTIARRLSRELVEVDVLHLEQQGRGRALRAAWSKSDADVLAYMDVDLSTDLSALAPLLEPLLEGRADLMIGSRLAPGAQVTRSLKREIISRSYNLLLHVLLGVGFSDAQCGFKAGRRELIQPLLGEVRDDAWFFDTELLCLAGPRKLAIREIPVRWVEDADSRVRILETALEDMRGVLRLRRAARGGAAGILAPDARARSEGQPRGGPRGRPPHRRDRPGTARAARSRLRRRRGRGRPAGAQGARAARVRRRRRPDERATGRARDPVREPVHAVWGHAPRQQAELHRGSAA